MIIKFRDFVPPIFGRAWSYARRKYLSAYGGDFRLHPFDIYPVDFTPALIWDVGANLGDVSALACKSFGNCKVVAFEPVSSTYLKLNERMRSFRDRFTAVQAAASNTNGSVSINITSQHGANSIEPQTYTHSKLNPHVLEVSHEEISALRLDAFHEAQGCPYIDILKIDVEGHETKVLSGCGDMLGSHVKSVIIEIAFARDTDHSSQAIFEIFNIMNAQKFFVYSMFDLHFSRASNTHLVQVDLIFFNSRYFS